MWATFLIVVVPVANSATTASVWTVSLIRFISTSTPCNGPPITVIEFGSRLTSHPICSRQDTNSTSPCRLCSVNPSTVTDPPQIAAAAVRAIVKTQRALKADPSLAAKVGTRLFPSEEASLIGGLVARDAPFYEATISPEAVEGLNKFAGANGLISQPVSYDQLVAPPFIRQLWNE